MNRMLILFVSLTVASASVVPLPATLYSAADIPITTHFHNQDSLGQYSYGYSGGASTRAEYKSLDGVIRGSYSYVDSDGKLQTVEYTADGENGFQASATNLPTAPIDDRAPPKPVEDTPEVAMARAEHLAAVREAELRAAENPSDSSDDQSQDQQQNGSQEAQAAMSRESTSAETESPTPMEPQEEKVSETPSSVNEKETDALLGLFNGLDLSGALNGSFSSLSTLTLGNPLLPAGEHGLGELTSDLASPSIGSLTPATTTELRQFPLSSLPTASYLRVATPTHGYSIVSPTVLTAVPTLPAASSQTISRPLPIPLTPNFLTQGLL